MSRLVLELFFSCNQERIFKQKLIFFLINPFHFQIIGITFQITERNSDNLPFQNCLICVDSNNIIYSYILFIIINNITHTVT